MSCVGSSSGARPLQNHGIQPHPADAGRSGEQGFSIIVVLIVLSLLALVTILLQRSVVIDIRNAAHLTQHTRAEALADGLTRLAIRHLSANPPSAGRSGPLRTDGVPATCRVGADFATVAFTNTDGLVNLNLASQALLTRVITGIGLASDDAGRLARDIVDYRTVGDASVAGGSKTQAYRQAGLLLGPRNGPFLSVGELDQVIGMTPALFARLQPLMTVHSASGVVNKQLMTLPVALALAGSAAPSQDLDILRTRLDLPFEFTLVPRTRSSGAGTSNTYLVRVTVEQGGQARFTRAAVVGLTGLETGAALKEWAELDRQRYRIDPPPAADTPACIGGLLSLDPP